MQISSRLRRISLVAALIFLASFFVPINSAQAAPTAQTLNLIGGNTDASHAVGTQDPFTETSTDNGVTWGPAYLVGNGHPWGLVTGTNSWINCGPSLTDCLMATSLYRYRFWVPADFTSPKLNGAMIMDNYGSVSLNGNSLVNNAPANYTFPANTDLTGKLQAGWNELRVSLLDVGGLTGINFNLEVGIVSASSMSLASPGKLVIYDGQAGTPSRGTDTATTASPTIATLPTATRAGYDLVGWFTATTGGTQIPEPFTPTGDVTVYARWALANYNVNYDEAGGVAVADSTFQMGGTVTLAPATSRGGYTFDGWFDAPTGGTQYGATFTPATLASIIIYAHWTAIPAPPPPPPAPVVTPTPTPTPTPTLTPTPTPTPTPTNPPANGIAAARGNIPFQMAGFGFVSPTNAKLAKLITTFVGDRSELRPVMVTELNKLILKLKKSSQIMCLGSTSGVSITPWDRKLAADRARKVCAYIATHIPGANYSILINPSSANLPAARHTWVYATAN